MTNGPAIIATLTAASEYFFSLNPLVKVQLTFRETSARTCIQVVQLPQTNEFDVVLGPFFQETCSRLLIESLKERSITAMSPRSLDPITMNSTRFPNLFRFPPGSETLAVQTAALIEAMGIQEVTLLSDQTQLLAIIFSSLFLEEAARRNINIVKIVNLTILDFTMPNESSIQAKLIEAWLAGCPYIVANMYVLVSSNAPYNLSKSSTTKSSGDISGRTDWNARGGISVVYGGSWYFACTLV